MIQLQGSVSGHGPLLDDFLQGCENCFLKLNVTKDVMILEESPILFLKALLRDSSLNSSSAIWVLSLIVS